MIDVLINEATLWLPRVGAAVGIVAGFFLFSRIIAKSIIRGSQRLNLDNNLIALFARSSSITLMLFGFITALGTLGINVSALVAGLGLTGFALGFALKDTVTNLISGVLILLYKPFRIGNTIKIAGYEGIVVAIDLRYTELNSDGSKILIPNSKLFTDPITVSTIEKNNDLELE